MTDHELSAFVRRLYWLAGLYGLAGAVWMLWLEGFREGLGFALGALGSLANLWLFEWLSGAISPSESTRKPWHAAAFIGRYLVLFLVGYVIVKALDVNLLPVVFGLLASTAAVVTSSIIEIIQGLLGKQTSR